MVSSAGRSRVGLAAQAFALRSAYPDSRPVIRNGRLTWTHSLRPTPASCSYEVRLEARPYRQAEIFVMFPALQTDEQGRLPHVYGNGALCLNRAGEWREGHLFIDTCVPWTLEWLFFYELWLVDHVWRGDGIDETDLRGQAAILHPYVAPTAGRPTAGP